MTTATKTKVQQIVINRLEGPIGCDSEYVVSSWSEADTALARESWTAPKSGGYDKTDFTITFENGHTYSGRYDLKHMSVEFPNLQAHVRDFVRFSAGIDCPEHMTEESWREYLRAVEQYSPGASEQFADLYYNYEIGL